MYQKVIILLICLTSVIFSEETLSDKVIVGVVQYSFSQNPEENQRKAIYFIQEAAKKNAKIILLPELYNSHYFCQEENPKYFDLAEPLQGKTYQTFSKLAKKLNVTILIPFFEKRAPGIYHNSIMIIKNTGELVGSYRKMHIPDDPLYYEKFYFTCGDLGYKVFPIDNLKISTFICWDQWFPEVARIACLQGSECLFYPSAIGWHPKEKELYGACQKDSWITIQRSHAIANGVYVVCSNRVGLEKIVPCSDGIEFWGSSFICDPYGQILAQASIDKEEVIIAEIDLKLLETARRNWPFFRDRRPETYIPITKLFIDEVYEH